MRPISFDSHRMVSWVGWLGQWLRAAVQWGSRHTGLPVVLFAAVALVASWHLFRRTMRFAIEVVLAALVLLAATRMGWVVW